MKYQIHKNKCGVSKAGIIRVYIICFFLLFLGQNSIGQFVMSATGTTPPAGNNFYLTVPLLNMEGNAMPFRNVCEPSICGTNPRLVAFVETADGQFGWSVESNVSNDPEGNPNPQSRFSFSYNVYESVIHGAPYYSLAKVIGIYGSPPRKEIITHLPTTTDIPGIINPIISSSSPGNRVFTDASVDIVKITPNIWDIAEDDPMIFIISYKLNPPETRNLKIEFNYNFKDGNIEGSDENIFTPISGIGERTTLEYFPAPSATPVLGNSINSIRCYNAEVPMIGSDLKKITFTNLKIDGSEHHIFVSLRPLVNLSGNNSAEQFSSKKALLNAVLLSKSSSLELIDFKGIDTFLLQMPTAKGHDPNTISIFPNCLKPGSSSVPLNYKVTFRNLGRGSVDDVEIFVKPGFNVNSASLNPGTIHGFCKAADRSLTRGPSVVSPVVEYRGVNAAGELIFKITNAKLAPALSWEDNTSITTCGELNFTLNTTGFPNLAGFQASARIRFDNEPSLETNPTTVGICPASSRGWKWCRD